MMSDAKLREQTYSYFLTEAQDLLQSIEQHLFSLRQDRSAAKVHELMRAAHTLKGAAASVEFESVKTIAHSFEDVFKALFKPEVTIDAELEALLYEGYDCLRMPITAAIAGVSCQEAEVLNRAEAIFSQIRKKLGRHFDADAAIPTSAELGFDLVQSMFETGVQERLEQLESVLAAGNSTAIAETLQTQAEVFLGLAESLSLKGFGAIAQTALTALKRQPDRVQDIAKAALIDFRQGQSAVLSGDRVSGGEVSTALKQFAGLSQKPNDSVPSAWTRLKRFLRRSLLNPPTVKPEPSQNIPESNDLFTVDPAFEQLATEFAAQAELQDLGFQDLNFQDSNLQDSSSNMEFWDAEPALNDASNHAALTVSPPVVAAPPQSVAQKATLSDTIRVDLANLESLNLIASELLIYQNQQLLQDEQLQVMLVDLVDRLNRHQQMLSQLKDWASIAPERFARGGHSLATNSDLKQKFDPLELDRYNEFYVRLQRAVTEAEQLETVAEAIGFLARESRLTRGKQGRLLSNLRDDLITVRMMPIGTIFNRLPAVVQQLSETYGKTVNLRLAGTEVMVDKALAEKLYDPLLHLVRNAFDHGVEPDSLRSQQGKSIGEIEVRAYQQGNRTVIEVKDNGRGLDLQKICQRGFEQGRLPSCYVDRCSESELLNLLFEPGFSTAEQVTDLSGRGVGLDVVRSQIQAMRGTVTITSEPNQGTTFSLQLPLTLISARLLVCQAGHAIYGMISEDVIRIVSPSSAEVEQLGQQRVLHWRYEDEKQTVPIHSLSDAVTYTNRLISLQAALHSTEELRTVPALTSSILICRHQNTWVGIEVDRVLGEQELVLRPVGNTLTPPSYIYGCSVLGDGRSLLAIDAVALVERNQARSNAVPTQSTLIAKTVLVVDDSLTVRQTVAATLNRAGYQVIQAQDGLEAIAQLQQHPEIQLITCDIEMPRLNGFEFLKRYKQASQAPVVMLTSRTSEKHQQLAKQLGAAAYLTKPYDQGELLQLVEQLINAKVVQ
ncbi:hybrid sensor histidine kinase/response regulator [Leptolyngbya sp. DQ-M1]|uniref:hybrid sensor histidine kinase/response regulator n=1 Tax=Leptolyngbya sp. DQ-M1 TaxID=2933920 RepID=UPI0032974573